jgi:hypothetical protein
LQRTRVVTRDVSRRAIALGMQRRRGQAKHRVIGSTEAAIGAHSCNTGIGEFAIGHCQQCQDLLAARSMLLHDAALMPIDQAHLHYRL